MRATFLMQKGWSHKRGSTVLEITCYLVTVHMQEGHGKDQYGHIRAALPARPLGSVEGGQGPGTPPRGRPEQAVPTPAQDAGGRHVSTQDAGACDARAQCNAMYTLC